MDLFILPEGLRLRDHLSHGEMNSHDVNESLASIIIILCVLLSHSPRDVDSEILDGLFCDKATCACYASLVYKNISEIIQAYHPFFHPLAFAKRITLKSLQSHQCENFSCFTELLTPMSLPEQQINVKVTSLTSRFLKPYDTNCDVKARADAFKQKQVHTLYR